MEEVLAIRISEVGEIECLHDESLGLHELGSLTVRRASSVEHDGKEWVAEDLDTGEIIARDTLRSKCIEAEVRHFNRKIAEGLRPFGSQ